MKKLLIALLAAVGLAGAVFAQGVIQPGPNVIVPTEGATLLREQNADNVKLTGGAIDGTVIGGTTAAAGTFTTMTATTIGGTPTLANLPTFPNQTANKVLAGPSSGAAVAPSFRTLATADVVAVMPAATPRNLLDNGAFNLYQRGAAAVAAINTTATYHADRWAGYANNASASVTLTNVTTSLPAQFSNAEQVQRANANTNTQAIFLAQEIPSTDVIAAQGQTVCVSAWLVAGANFSAASSDITVQVVTGTGTDQGLASLISASWSGQATTLNSSAQAITTSWARYTPAGWCFTMPSSATEAALQFGFTPVGTAGANDWFKVTGAQLEIAPSASPFEFRPISVERQKARDYYQQITEVNGTFFATGQCTATNVDTIPITLSQPMRAAPTAAITAGGFQLVINGAAAAAISGQGVGTQGPQTVVVTATNACTAGNVVSLRGSNTTGTITLMADF
jgi:hypothetical protein